MYRYAVKFVCGAAKGDILAPGKYWTAINVHNPTTNTVKFRKRISIALPDEKAGKVTAWVDAKLGEDEALEIDMKDIFQHAEQRAEFLKGFVIIESRIELDVVAVYTATAGEASLTMHMERVFPRRHVVDKPDLIPVPNEKGSFCKREGRDLLIVTVKNQGTRVAVSSVTKVDYRKHGSITEQTPSLAPGQSVNLPFKIPMGCFDPDCEFDITVDADDNVIESDEGNNTASGTCKGS